jgi:hypothetical protein
MNRPMMTIGSDRSKVVLATIDPAPGTVKWQRLGVVGEQHQRGETGGADGVALGDRLGGVADGVQRIGDVADLLVQTGHLGDAAGVVGDRAVGVQRDDDAGHAEHRGGGDGDAVEAASQWRARSPDRPPAPAPRWPSSRRQTGDDVGAMTGGRRPWRSVRTGEYSVAV